MVLEDAANSTVRLRCHMNWVWGHTVDDLHFMMLVPTVSSAVIEGHSSNFDGRLAERSEDITLHLFRVTQDAVQVVAETGSGTCRGEIRRLMEL